MPVAVPYQLLVADAVAWPFISEKAFLLGLVRLKRSSPGLVNGDTKCVGVEFDEWIRTRSGGLSMEATRQIRNAAWFSSSRLRDSHEPKRSIPLHSYLLSIACDYLELSGSRVVLTENINNARHQHPVPAYLEERAARWRWLSLLMPPDIFIASVCAARNIKPSTDHVSLVTQQLRRLLDEPVAETHLHLGAASSFSLLWTHLTSYIASRKFRDGNFKDGALMGGGTYPKWLLTAMLVRYTLGKFMDDRRRCDDLKIKQFVESNLRTIWQERLCSTGVFELREHLEAIYAFIRPNNYGSLPLSIERLRHLYKKFAKIILKSPPGAVKEVLKLDPLFHIASADVKGEATPETGFLFNCLRYLDTSGRNDSLFEKLFLQYIRVRCITYRWLVQEPGTAGLDWFNRFYKRIRTFLGDGLEPLAVKAALRTESKDVCLASLEVRQRPENKWFKVYKKISVAAKQNEYFNKHEDVKGELYPGKHLQKKEIGIVFHFTKEKEIENTSNRMLHADPRQRAFGCRYGSYFYQRRIEAMAIAGALRRCPALLVFLRGMDVASTELDEPTWAFLPLLDIVSDAAMKASDRLAQNAWFKKRGCATPEPMRLTFHAGEDFRRLAEGLRRIHEVVEFLPFRHGDRIGHGVALGTNPKIWAESYLVSTQPREERLDDLIWEMELYRRDDLPVHSGRLEFVRAEIGRLGQIIYGGTGIEPTVENMIESRRLRYDRKLLKLWRFPFMRESYTRPLGSTAERLVFHYLTNVHVFVRGYEPEEVRCNDSEVQFLDCAQEWLCKELSRRGATIETNPSSNLLIADLNDLDTHPAFRFNPLPGRNEDNRTSVLMSINDDNPITFSTCLADEFAYIFFTMLRLRVSSRDALEWLERARTSGWKSRFTLEVSKYPDVIKLIKLNPIF